MTTTATEPSAAGMTGASPRVAVVGGGLAGITAALRCADAGHIVTLFESRPRLGGLTHSFARDGLWVDNGQHVFLRCCIEYQALLDRLGVSDQVTIQQRLDIPVRSAGRVGRLRRNRLPAPLHLVGALARYRWLTPGQRLRFIGAAQALRGVDVHDPQTDRQSFGDWLRRHGQDRHAIDALWDLIGIATLNARADDASLALAATVFQRGLLSDRAAGDIGWSAVPLQQLHGSSAAAALADAGVDVLLRTKVEQIQQRGSTWSVHAAGRTIEVDEVIVAAPPRTAERLLPDGAVTLRDSWSAELGSSPIVNLHLVLDRPVLATPFLACVDSSVQWIFDRTKQSGLNDGQCLAVSLSAADELIDVPTAVLRDRLLPELQSLLPSLRSAMLRDFFVTRERDATFRQSPGSATCRPPCRTALPGLHLAGAWTATGWPATMEGAVRSGNTAAAAVLGRTRRATAQEAPA